MTSRLWRSHGENFEQILRFVDPETFMICVKRIRDFYAALLPRRGPHIASHSVCPSVCLSVRLSVRPVIITERHV